MSFIKRLQEKIDHVTSEMEGICLENEHSSTDNGPRVCTDCALAIEIMESSFDELKVEHGSDNKMA
jgi:hypothetical protein